MTGWSRRRVLGALAAVALCLALGWSDGHYWDEYFYLYSAAMHPPTELVSYELRTALFPPGFFSEKIGHVVLLRLLTRAFGMGEHVLYAIQALYGLLLVGCFGAAYGLLHDLFGEQWTRRATPVLVFSPLALYLPFKVMSEVPSLLLVTLGSWAFVRSFRHTAPRGSRACLGLATLGLAAGMLCRITTIMAFAGLGLALLVSGDERFARRRLLLRLVLVGTAVGVLHTAALASTGGSILRIGAHIQAVVATHVPLQRVYALALFVQAFALVLPFVWRARTERPVRVAAVWFAASALPFLAGHEPRYYAPALVPFAVLAAAALEGAVQGLAGPRRRYAWAALLATVTLLDRGLLVPLMPYEVEQGHLLALFERLETRRPRSSYLVPWISDFSLLRFAHPDAPVGLCLSNLSGTRVSQPGHAGPLPAADRWWAGPDHYVGSRAALARWPAPWTYVGWTYSPAALRLRRLLASAGLGQWMPAGAELHNHLAGSWIWHDPTLRLTPTDALGEYRAYELSPRAHGDREP